MITARVLFLARYRVPHAAFALQFDHYLKNIDHTVIATPMTRTELEPVWAKYGIDSSKFVYTNDQVIYNQYPEVNRWVFPDDYRGWWLRQQAIKLAYLDLLDADVMLMQDADTFMTEDYSPVVNGQLNMLAIMNTQQDSYNGVFEAITGIAHPSPHCFVTELCAVRKQDFVQLKQHLESRWPNKPWLDAIIDAVPGMPTVPPWGTGNIIKWFSEYELLGNWATVCGNVVLQPQRRFEYSSLEKIADFDAGYNAVCDAIPDLSQSMQINWDTLDIANFDHYKNIVLERLCEIQH
jgi:hypothetical protein